MATLITAGFVILTQIIAFLFLLVIRYHFRAFSIPGDARAARLARLATQGAVAGCVAVVAALAFFLLREASRFDAFLQTLSYLP